MLISTNRLARERDGRWRQSQSWAMHDRGHESIPQSFSRESKTSSREYFHPQTREIDRRELGPPPPVPL